MVKITFVFPTKNPNFMFFTNFYPTFFFLAHHFHDFSKKNVKKSQLFRQYLGLKNENSNLGHFWKNVKMVVETKKKQKKHCFFHLFFSEKKQMGRWKVSTPFWDTPYFHVSKTIFDIYKIFGFEKISLLNPWLIPEII